MSRFDRVLIALRKRWWRPTPLPRPFTDLTRSSKRVFFLIRVFYLLNFYVWLKGLLDFNALNLMLVVRPVWALAWLGNEADYHFLGRTAYVINLFLAVLGALRPERRLARVLAFLGVFSLSAIYASDGAGWERMTNTPAFVLIAFVLIFTPEPTSALRRRAWDSTLLFVLCETTFLASYVSSGIWRIRDSLYAVQHGKVPMIGTTGLAHAISGFYFGWHRTGFFGPFLLNHPALSALGMLFATLLELSAFFVLFRPGLYRLYGIAVLLLHLGFRLTMNLTFNDHLLPCLAFLLFSPFGVREPGLASKITWRSRKATAE